eukprot:2604373-Prymnesium_polylepis.1
MAVEVNGGKLKIQREDEDPIWVTCGHVQVVEAAGEAGGAAAAPPAAQPEGEGDAPMPQAESDNDGSSDDGDGGNDGDREAAQTGGGIKAAAKKGKKEKKRCPVGAKGHVWKPDWLSQFPWLRTEPQKTQDEWEDTKDLAPDYIFCICL